MKVTITIECDKVEQDSNIIIFSFCGKKIITVEAKELEKTNIHF